MKFTIQCLFLNRTVFTVQPRPQSLHLLSTTLLQHVVAACQVELDMMVVSQDQFDKHLNSTIDSNGNQHQFSVIIRTHARLSNHNINVNTDISKNTIPKNPILFNSYHEETKNTFSV